MIDPDVTDGTRPTQDRNGGIAGQLHRRPRPLFYHTVFLVHLLFLFFLLFFFPSFLHPFVLVNIIQYACDRFWPARN